MAGACTGRIGDTGERGPGGLAGDGMLPGEDSDKLGERDPEGPGGTNDDLDGDGQSDEDGDRDNQGGGLSVTPAPQAQLVRLTHEQWRNTVADLLEVDATTIDAFSLREDPKQSGFVFDNDAHALMVDGALWSGYQQAATDLAEHVSSDAERLARATADQCEPATEMKTASFAFDHDSVFFAPIIDDQLGPETGPVAVVSEPGWYVWQLPAAALESDFDEIRVALRVQGASDTSVEVRINLNDKNVLVEEIAPGTHTVAVSADLPANTATKVGVRLMAMSGTLTVDNMGLELVGRATVSCDAGDALEARRDAFIDAFGLRAHRRPLSDDDRSAYRALFDQGATIYPSMEAFAAGARLVVSGMLQSPMFLYRIEQQREEDDGPAPLDGFEIASRLAYFLWNTMPDDELLAAAEDDRLATRKEIKEQVDRMLDHPRASAMVRGFHAQLLESDRLSGVMPSSNAFGDQSKLGSDAAQERDRFVSHVFEQGGNFSDLLTSRETFVNARLAEIYGLSGDFDDEFVPVELDPETRSGLFTQVGFLATHATSVDPDPIHRGKFLAERMTCKEIAAPPADIPPPPEVADQTNREWIEEYTQQPGTACAGCHSTIINPFGFPFEEFDAIGTHRTTDRDKPVDTAASPLLDGEPTSVEGAVDLASALAESDEAHRCYVKHWLEYAHGRHEHENDAALLEHLTGVSRAADSSLSELLVEMILNDAFLMRSTEDQP